jgi:hypothetical protein
LTPKGLTSVISVQKERTDVADPVGVGRVDGEAGPHVMPSQLNHLGGFQPATGPA